MRAAQIAQIALLVVILVVLLAFALVNRESIAVAVPLGAEPLRGPTWLVILVSYLLGMVSGWSALGFLNRSIRQAAHRRHD